ncbi:hypothetical protein N7504_010854 [Penicillium tannophilum]|nr:hypothetical protein N7504_010854 [Penicillium tannophilum]
MPVTLTTSNHPALKWNHSRVSTAEELLQNSCPEASRHSRKLIQHSFPSDLFHTSHISDSQQGFVWAVFRATIRREDVWFSILTQLNFFINAHAEELRSTFVAHDGQKALQIVGVGTTATVDFVALALLMTKKKIGL